MKKFVTFLSIFTIFLSCNIYGQTTITVSFEHDYYEADSFKMYRLTEFASFPLDYYKNVGIRLFAYKILVEIKAFCENTYDDLLLKCYNESEFYTLAIVPGDIIQNQPYFVPLSSHHQPALTPNKTRHSDVIILDNTKTIGSYFKLFKDNNYIVRLYDLRG